MHWAAISIVGIMLSACGADQDELQQWMDQQKREVKPNVQPLSPPKKFIPQAYSAVGSVEPFSTQKLTVALKQIFQGFLERLLFWTIVVILGAVVLIVLQLLEQG